MEVWSVEEIRARLARLERDETRLGAGPLSGYVPAEGERPLVLSGLPEKTADRSGEKPHQKQTGGEVANLDDPKLGRPCLAKTAPFQKQTDRGLLNRPKTTSKSITIPKIKLRLNLVDLFRPALLTSRRSDLHLSVQCRETWRFTRHPAGRSLALLSCRFENLFEKTVLKTQTPEIRERQPRGLINARKRQRKSAAALQKFRSEGS